MHKTKKKNKKCIPYIDERGGGRFNFDKMLRQIDFIHIKRN